MMTALEDKHIEEFQRLKRSHDALVEAAEDFVAKVERGEARSVDSYAKFKAALALSKGETQ